ncbi:endonuclease/exonuclease/phosphatase family protein [Solirubrobacter ginsenosidimutans]|uniref:Endonuclease/exonuclease/phosphatase family protein n=1 Tax=Solirubrobacter ginsenosidimutans TaxID=490573 RepID=A0A9X3MXG3_9ACTN|nr:endonuclease/exonuclease/phosphatase family protein [Solirubrobacter ginsenosidimutans]MDA0164509.1 endonuclease/exonuclease/phosphatase family protein [Solirubrobacter ginsenosidimutans]
MRNVVAVVVALPWVVWAGVRTLGFELPYPFVALLAFTPYAALSSPVPVVAALLLRRWVVAGVAGVAVAAFALALVPRAVGGPEPEADGPRLVVMTSNLYLGQADARAVMRIAREHDVDVWSLQELRPGLVRKLDRAGAKTLFPDRVLDPRERASGSGVLSRTPLAVVDTAPNRQGHAEPEVSLKVAGAPPVRIKAVHPAPPVNPTAAPLWRGALEALPSSDGRGDVQILAGDFNATLDHPELRALLGRGYTDAADAAGKGFTSTWPWLRRTRALPLTIDHILVDKRVTVEKVTVVRVPGSDHRAVIAVLRLPRQ